MPRICNLSGCNKPLLRKDGTPDFRRHFCSKACLAIDKRERLQAKKNRLKNHRCPHCGRSPVPAAASDRPLKLQHTPKNAQPCPDVLAANQIEKSPIREVTT